LRIKRDSTVKLQGRKRQGLQRFLSAHQPQPLSRYDGVNAPLARKGRKRALARNLCEAQTPDLSAHILTYCKLAGRSSAVSPWHGSDLSSVKAHALSFTTAF
jgi:hypothetical protein